LKNKPQGVLLDVKYRGGNQFLQQLGTAVASHTCAGGILLSHSPPGNSSMFEMHNL